MSSRWWSLHTHSLYSVNDALSNIPEMVATAANLDYPALGLTDHGSPSGAPQLYTECRKAGIEPLPGMELYVTADAENKAQARNTMHLTMAAYTEKGYRNLSRFSTLANRKFFYKPILDFADFAAAAEVGGTDGLVVSTGCYFGVLPTVLREQGEDAAVHLAKVLAGWFPRLYVEVQNHGISGHNAGVENEMTDDETMFAMARIATRASLPMIATRDSHYTFKADRPQHEALKRMVGWSDDPSEATFPGGGYFMASEQDMADYIPAEILEPCLDSLADLASAARVRIPELDNFSTIVPDISTGGDPYEELETMIMGLVPEWMRKRSDYMESLSEELEVIRTTDAASYFLLVNLVCDYMRSQGIRYTARGSASGSMVCWLLGITQLDPIKYKLRFDRFMSHNRIKPPDVDLDVEHLRRDEVIEFMESRFYVQAVGSLRKYTLHGDDEMDPEMEDSKGSLRERYYTVQAKMGMPKPDWKHVPEEDKRMLHALSDRKLISGYGRHAAGYIVAPNRKVLDDIPLAYIASSKRFVTAYGKKDVERMGYTKLDLLGLRTQTAIRLMIETSGVDFDDIPLTDKRTYGAISQGRTVGVFQLGGVAMVIGCKQMRPRKLEDIIAAQALFRPAARDSGATDEFLARRRGRASAEERHEDIAAAVRDTYGVIIYQEQIMQVMSNLGMNKLELEGMLDAVKASNEYTAGATKVIEEMLPRIRELAVDRGWTQADISWLVDAIPAFAGYSFNRSHAAAYGLIAYRCAWMRVNKPLHFWAATLAAFETSTKIKVLEREARSDGIRLMPAHVNKSRETYTIDEERGTIRRGLRSVRGVKAAATEIVENAPYTSLRDFGERVSNRVTGTKHLAIGKTPEEAGGMALTLFEAGALSGLEDHE